MPWEIVKGQGCPDDQPYAVVKKGTSQREGCHPSRESAKRQVAALYSAENEKGTLDPEDWEDAIELTLEDD